MNAKNVDDAYAVLGLRPGACREEIIQAWKDLALLWDPSVHSTGSKSHEQAVRMLEATNAAYELLISQQPDGQPPVSAEYAKSGFRTAKMPDDLFVDAKELESANLAGAIEMYKRLAQIGHVKSQFRLGFLHFEGPAKDLTQAAYWWKRASEQGHVVAQFNLALMYERGVGMPQDLHQAQYWFSEAAKRGDVQAKRKLRNLNETSTQTRIFQQSQTPTQTQSNYQKPAISQSDAQALLPWNQNNQPRSSHDSIAKKDYLSKKKNVS